MAELHTCKVSTTTKCLRDFDKTQEFYENQNTQLLFKLEEVKQQLVKEKAQVAELTKKNADLLQTIKSNKRQALHIISSRQEKIVQVTSQMLKLEHSLSNLKLKAKIAKSASPHK